jgi:hypothetical protein
MVETAVVVVVEMVVVVVDKHAGNRVYMSHAARGDSAPGEALNVRHRPAGSVFSP